MFCQSCGKENNDNTKFCVFCGTALTAPAPTPAPAAQMPAEEASVTEMPVEEVLAAQTPAYDQAVPSAEDQPAPPVNDQPTPPAGDPVMSGQPTPPAGEQQMNDQPTPPAGDPVMSGQPTPPAGEQAVYGQPVPPVVSQPVSGQPTPPMGEQIYGQPMPPAGGQPVYGQPMPPVGGQPMYGQPVPPAYQGMPPMGGQPVPPAGGPYMQNQNLPLGVPPEKQNSGKKGKGGIIALIICLVLVLLGGGGFAGYKFIAKSNHEKAVNSKLEEAAGYADAGKYSDAVEAYIEVLDELDPNSEEAVNGLTDAYVAWAKDYAAKGEYDKAISLLESADGRAFKKTIKAELSEIQDEKAAWEETQRQEEEARLAEEQKRAEEEAKANSGSTLQSYYYSDLVPTYGEVDKNATYESSYYVPEEYEYDEYKIGRVAYLDVLRGSILAYDIRDWDKDGWAEMLVIFLDQYGSDSYGRRVNDYYMNMYEVDGTNVYLSSSMYAVYDVLGGCDWEWQSFMIKDDGEHVYLAIEDMFAQYLFDETKFMSVDLFDYSEENGFTELYYNSVRGYDFEDDETFSETADAMRAYGFSATARLIDDRTYSNYEYDENGDGMEVFLTIMGISEIVLDYDGYIDSGRLDPWIDNNDPAGLGAVYYEFY